MDMGSLGLAQLGCQPAFEAKGGELCRKFDHQYRIGKASQRIGAIDTTGQPCLMIQDCSNRSPAGPLKGTLSIAVSGICHHNGLPVYLRSETSGLFMSCVTTD